MAEEEMQVKIFKALGHPVRMKIVKILFEGEMCACKFINDVEFSQSNLSQHLKILKEAKIVSSEKRGMNVIYTLTNSNIAEIIKISEKAIEEIIKKG